MTMTHTPTAAHEIADLGTLCRALGFLAVAMRADNLNKAGGAERAEKLAKLIEEFSRASSGAPTLIPANSAWSCDHLSDRSVIRHIGSDTVIEVRGGAATITAEHIVHAVNDNNCKDALIAEMATCLEACMKSNTLDWDTEQEADVLVARARQMRAKR